ADYGRSSAASFYEGGASANISRAMLSDSGGYATKKPAFLRGRRLGGAAMHRQQLKKVGSWTSSENIFNASTDLLMQLSHFDGEGRLNAASSANASYDLSSIGNLNMDEHHMRKFFTNHAPSCPLETLKHLAKTGEQEEVMLCARLQYYYCQISPHESLGDYSRKWFAYDPLPGASNLLGTPPGGAFPAAFAKASSGDSTLSPGRTDEGGTSSSARHQCSAARASDSKANGGSNFFSPSASHKPKDDRSAGLLGARTSSGVLNRTSSSASSSSSTRTPDQSKWSRTRRKPAASIVSENSSYGLR
ncbi:unnamed protein product, partial [Amoebophrya sp. A25]